jgi:hypothetical protein
MKCNLTNKKIIYPVLGKDGYLYEHAEIIYYLIRNYKSPKTNESMDIFDLIIYKNNKPKYGYDFIKKRFIKYFIKIKNFILK